MSLVLVTAPTQEPITLSDVKAQCRIDTSDDDALLNGLITAVRTHLDGRDGHLGRALCQQTWDLKLDGLAGDIRIPLPPLRSVTYVKYLDSVGVEQTLDAAVYQIVGVDSGWPGYITPAYGQFWPACYPVPECVTVRFVCGYAPAGSPLDYAVNIPKAIKQAMLLTVADLYKFRENAGSNALAEVPMSATAEALLAPFRVWDFA